MWYESYIEYNIIEQFYEDKIAKRSRVPLINHIKEGIAILNEINASDNAIRGFCLHPIIQSDVEYYNNIEYILEFVNTGHISPYVLILALEYRIKANSYLCKSETDSWIIDTISNKVGKMSADVRDMLIADKIQNKKDFNFYHKGIHERSVQLEKYFDLWLEFLHNDEKCLLKNFS